MDSHLKWLKYGEKALENLQKVSQILRIEVSGIVQRASLAQSVERGPFKPVVAGSSPAGGVFVVARREVDCHMRFCVLGFWNSVVCG